MLSYNEFFAGGGLTRAGLGSDWQCLFANDIDQKKCNVYRSNWGDGELTVGDVSKLKQSDITGNADLVWASFPCQDLSLAGGGAGLQGNRSGTFWPFWKVVWRLVSDKRAPKIIVLENVCGTLTSHEGKDFASICSAIKDAGYRYGAVIIDAKLFVPQSRPRLFFIAIKRDINIPETLLSNCPIDEWHRPALVRAYESLTPYNKNYWMWWGMPEPAKRKSVIADLVEENPDSTSWHSEDQTRTLLEMMSKLNRAKVRAAMKSGNRAIGTVYKRIRTDDTGKKVQRAEIRFDDVAGCLRTPVGGSSRQMIMVIDENTVRSRLISSREAARLMGLPDHYKLPIKYNEAYHIMGDGVAVPVVRYIAQHILEPVLLADSRE